MLKPCTLSTTVMVTSCYAASMSYAITLLPHVTISMRIIAFAKRHIAYMNFSTVFLTKLFPHCKQGQIPSDVAPKVSRVILSEWIPLFSIDSGENPSKRQRISHTSVKGPGLSDSPVVGPTHRFVSGEAMADVHGHCLSLRLLQEVDHIVAKLINRMHTVAISAYDSVYLPCLAKLFKIIQPNLEAPEVFRLPWLFFTLRQHVPTALRSRRAHTA